MAQAEKLSSQDVEVLRPLAERKRQIADDPANLERKRLWYQLDEGVPDRPLVMAEVHGLRDSTQPVPDAVLQCADPTAREVERVIRREIHQFDVLRDDHVVEPFIPLRWRIQLSDFGVPVVSRLGDSDGHMGSRRWEPGIRDLDRDFHKLRPRTYTVDRERTLAEKARIENAVAGVLPVEIRGPYWWTMGMTKWTVEIIGLDNLMLYMMDNPAGLHRLMAYLRDEHLGMARRMEKEGLLSLNNLNDYIGSGTNGYSRRLPQPDWQPGRPVRMSDLWVLLESQETVGVGPRQFEEFIFPYQLEIAHEFGRVYYGCCEPVHNRWHILKRLPRLARVSVSPWANEEIMARELGRDYVYSRKPSPAQISTEVFDEEKIRADLRKTLTVARGCRIELIMKDVHTLCDDPRRLPRWVEIAREVIEETA